MILLLPLLLPLPVSAGLDGEDEPAWGGFRGNNGTGVAVAGSVPASLDPEESALWRAEVPAGYSSPVVTSDSVFLTAAEGNTLVTLCLDRASGEEEWRRELEFDGKRVGMNSSAAPSPVTDGEAVYALFHARGLVAYDLGGEELWNQELGDFNIPHGMSTSPVVHGETLVLLVDQDMGAFLVAYDKRTGKERWKVERPGVTHSYSTPSIYAPAEGPAQVIVAGSFQLAAYSIDDGKKVWWMDGLAWQTKCVPVIDGDVCYLNAYMVPSGEFGIPPLKDTFIDELIERDHDGDGLIARSEWEGSEMLQQAWFIFDLDGDELLDERDWEYLRSSRTASGGLFAVDLTGKGDVTKSHVKWKFGDRRGLPDCASPLFVDGLLYMIKEGGLFTAVDPSSGEVVKQGRVAEPDQYFASPVAAGGRIVTASLGGQLTVVQAGPEWEVISVADLEEEIWSTPALADGEVFVRSQDAIWCFKQLAD
jgi:outer membrane protein assembly factor BamB